MAGLTLQISEIPAQIALEEFVLEARLKAIGQLDDSLNNEKYNYVTVSDGVATPWRHDNPVKPIGYKEGYLQISNLLLVHPLEAKAQQSIKRMPRAEPVILYIKHFAIHGNLTMGAEMALAGVMEGVLRRFLVMTDVSIFPMFPAAAALPEGMPVALVNRTLVTHYHGAGD
jgi:hypothetical protein